MCVCVYVCVACMRQMYYVLPVLHVGFVTLSE